MLHQQRNTILTNNIMSHLPLTFSQLSLKPLLRLCFIQKHINMGKDTQEKSKVSKVNIKKNDRLQEQSAGLRSLPPLVNYLVRSAWTSDLCEVVGHHIPHILSS